MSHLDKWKREVVHLEGATGSKVDLPPLVAASQADNYDPARSRDIRRQGTAIFFEDQGQRYLLTARHVLHDAVAAAAELQTITTRYESDEEYRRITDLEYVTKQVGKRLYSVIFRLPSIDELLGGLTDEAYIEHVLQNVECGPNPPYEFSGPGEDLAAIALDRQWNNAFTTGLIQNGFVPVRVSDIADGPLTEGDPVFAVGYPKAVSLMGCRELPGTAANWASDAISLPAFSFGRVSLLHDRLWFFWADLSIYPGNSGGPVVDATTGKLVGIVSAQAESEVHLKGGIVTSPAGEQVDPTAPIPFAQVTKSKYIRAVLDRLKSRLHLP